MCMRGINYDCVFLKRSPFGAYKNDEKFEEMFYLLLSRTALMINNIHHNKPPLEAVIEELESNFPDILLNKEKKKTFPFIGFMCRFILENLGFIYLAKSKPFKKGNSIKTQSIYAMKKEEENE